MTEESIDDPEEEADADETPEDQGPRDLVVPASGGLQTSVMPAEIEEKVRRVCRLVAHGRTLDYLDPYGRGVGRHIPPKGLPGRDEFWEILLTYPAAQQLYQRAREVGAFAIEEDLLIESRKMLRRKSRTAVDVAALNAFLGQGRWSAAKRNPNVFSDKAEVKVTVPVQINTSLDLGDGNAGNSTKEFPNIYEVKAEVTAEVSAPPKPKAIDPPVRMTPRGKMILKPAEPPDGDDISE